MDPIEETLVLIKPDALERGLTGEIIRRFETAGLRISNTRWVCPDLALVQRHYTDLQAKNPRAFDRNTRYLAGKNALALVLAGVNAIAKVRALIVPPSRPGRRREPSVVISVPMLSSAPMPKIAGFTTWSTPPTRMTPPGTKSRSGLAEWSSLCHGVLEEQGLIAVNVLTLQSQDL